jgi:serine/threonine protein kinase
MTSDVDDALDPDPIDLLVETYAQLCRSDEAPSIEAYAERYPSFASELRRLLPAVAFLERGKRPGSGSDLSARVAASQAPPTIAMERLGENRVVRELGRGGMGIVYEAIQEPLGRKVAVKMLIRHGLHDVTSRKRFLREIQVVAALDHPGIVPIYSGGEHEGVPYYVMALIDGVGLDKRLSRLPSVLPVDPSERARWAAGLILQAAEALAYAHEQGVLHRDIKPANLLLDDSGKLWLADFGLAKLADDLSLTGSGELPGTLRYLAPECLHGDADERSDIYSLGLTLYELLVGRPAFPEPNWARLLHQVGAQRPPAPRTVVPELPKDIEAIVLKATAKEPSDRYQSASDLVKDLERFLDGEAVAVSGRSSTVLLVRWSRNNRIVALLGSATLVLTLLTAYFGALYVMAPPHPRDDDPGLAPETKGFPDHEPLEFEGPPDRPPPPPPPEHWGKLPPPKGAFGREAPPKKHRPPPPKMPPPPR